MMGGVSRFPGVSAVGSPFVSTGHGLPDAAQGFTLLALPLLARLFVVALGLELFQQPVAGDLAFEDLQGLLDIIVLDNDFDT